MKRACAVAIAMLMTTTVFAQDDPAPPAQPPAGAEQLSAVVNELAGNAYVAPASAELLDRDAWKPLKQGDTIPPGSQIRTSVRTHLLLQIGDDTLVLAKQNTRMSLDQLYTTTDTKTTRMSLGHGTIRAGVAEGALRSDLTIDSTVATLSKRGTWGFEMSKFGSNVRMSLADRGLVEAIYKLTNQRRLVSPGQFVDNRSIARMWIMTAKFQQAFSMYQFAGLTGAEYKDNHLNTTGLAVVEPAPGVDTLTMAGRNVDPAQTGVLEEMTDDEAAESAVGLIADRNIFLNRNEGNFGFGDFPGLQNAAKRWRAWVSERRGGSLNGPFGGKIGDRRIRPLRGR